MLKFCRWCQSEKTRHTPAIIGPGRQRAPSLYGDVIASDARTTEISSAPCLICNGTGLMPAQTIAPISLAKPENLAEFRRIRLALRRQCRRNGRAAYCAGTDAGAAFGYETTVGAIALATKIMPERIVSHLQDAWLVILDGDESAAIETWRVSEDGE